MNYVDPEYCRGPPPNLHRNNFHNPYAMDEGPSPRIGRGRSVYTDYDPAPPRPGSQPKRLTPPSLLDPPTPSNHPEYTKAAKIVEEKYLPIINQLTQALKEQYDEAYNCRQFDLAKVEAYRYTVNSLVYLHQPITLESC